MGEYADMMLDGTCCASCGEFIGTDNGFATFCGGCAPDFGVEAYTGLPTVKARKRSGPAGKPKPCTCGTCGKSFKSKGARRNHRRRMHPASNPPKASDAAPASSTIVSDAVEAGVAGAEIARQ